jgi:hypothetical protein
VLEDPPGAPASAWTADFRRPRAIYAPAYAAAILPADAQVAVLPRGDRVAVVAAVSLPRDTTERARSAPAERNEARGPWRDAGAEVGLFLISERGEVLEARRPGSAGALIVEAPAGRWVASVETWDPATRRAGRTRFGVDVPARAPDQPTLSDLLLVGGGLTEGASLPEAAARALTRDWMIAGERVSLAWELFGLSVADDPLRYRLSLDPRRPGLLRRFARAIGFARPAAGRLLEWQEESPSRPGPVLRAVELDLTALDPGSWVIRLEVHPRGRSPLVVEREIEVHRVPQG